MLSEKSTNLNELKFDENGTCHLPEVEVDDGTRFEVDWIRVYQKESPMADDRSGTVSANSDGSKREDKNEEERKRNEQASSLHR